MPTCILGPDYATWDVTRADLELAREFDLSASQHMGGGQRIDPDGVGLMDTHGLLGPKLNIVHANTLSLDELKCIVDRGAGITIAPEVEVQMGFGTPVTNHLLELASAPSLGVDIESDVGGDMFSVLRFALQTARGYENQCRIDAGRKVETISPAAIDALEWATLRGATHLGLEKKIGSLSQGKQADIVLIRKTDLNLFPVHDPVQSLVIQANPANVDTVLIAGSLVKRHGRLVYPLLERKMAELEVSGRRLVANDSSG